MFVDNSALINWISSVYIMYINENNVRKAEKMTATFQIYMGITSQIQPTYFKKITRVVKYHFIGLINAKHDGDNKSFDANTYLLLLKRQ